MTKSRKAMLSEFQFDPENPNAGSERGARTIKESIGKFGFRDAGILDRDGRIVSGNQRTKAAETLGAEEAIVIQVSEDDAGKPIYLQFSDLDLADADNPARELALWLNRAAQLSINFDPTVLAKQRTAIDLSQLFTHGEQVRLGIRDDILPLEEATPPSSLDTLLEKWGVEPGQLWELPSRSGPPHLLYCGDSGEELPEPLRQEIHLLVTDPPYGVSYSGKQAKLNQLTNSNGRLEDGIASDDDMGQLTKVWRSVFRRVAPLMAEDATYYIFGPSGGRSGQTRHFLNVLAECGYGDTHILVWEKDNQAYSQTDYKIGHELIHYGWMERHDFHGGFEPAAIYCPRVKRNLWHPTQKPVSLLVRLMENSSEPGQTVADPFCGGGSTLLAADRIGRRFLGIEIDPKYISSTLERFQKETEREPLRLAP